MNICVFNTHTTLGYNHCDMCFEHLYRSYVNCNVFFDILYIYNSHEDELSNNDILILLKKHKISDLCEIKIFDYDKNTPKTLANDCMNIFNFLQKNYSSSDKVLLLKSDIMVSKNFLKDLIKVESQKFILTPPFIVAKKSCTDDEILEYTSRNTTILSDEITFYNEDEAQNKVDELLGKLPTDKNYKFASCTGKIDYSCHFLTLNIIPHIIFHIKMWGGVNFSNCKDFWLQPESSFVVHKYHSVKSKNCDYNRIGSIEDIMLS